MCREAHKPTSGIHLLSKDRLPGTRFTPFCAGWRNFVLSPGTALPLVCLPYLQLRH